MKLKSNSENKIIYVREFVGIKRLLKKAFDQKRKVKIKYYSLSSDEVKYRIIDRYQMHKDCIIAYCHLRNNERTFVMDRIIVARLLDEKYKIPNGRIPESIIK